LKRSVRCHDLPALWRGFSSKSVERLSKSDECHKTCLSKDMKEPRPEKYQEMGSPKNAKEKFTLDTCQPIDIPKNAERTSITPNVTVINKGILLKEIIKIDVEAWETYRDEARKKKETVKETARTEKTKKAAEMEYVIDLDYI
jgi:hypothetical protein